MSIQHPSTMGEPASLSPTQIFEEYLPKILDAQADLAKQIGGVCVFNISGDAGGIWTVDLPNLEVKTGDYSGPDLRLEMPADDFAEMLGGKLDAEQALQSGRLKFFGRPQLLVSLAALLHPPDIK